MQNFRWGRTVVATIALTVSTLAVAQGAPPIAPAPVPAYIPPPLPPIIVAPAYPMTPPRINCPPTVGTPNAPCSSLPPLPVPIAPALIPAPAVDGSAMNGEKVLSYFQRSVTPVDTRKAFGFVLMPKSAVTADETRLQARFCKIMLASMDFMAPDAVAQRKVLVTYWPIVAARSSLEIETAFEAHDCDHLLAWYDHKLARSIATRAGVAGLSGPLLITWPSEDAKHAAYRDPLIVDFAKADYEHATKALQYWFGQLRIEPKLWTSRIREGTVRAELADAINDTAGVVVAVLSGKWDSVTAVSETP